MKKLMFILFFNIFLIGYSANDGKVKVGLKAQVLDPTNLLMEIVPLDNAGNDNKSLGFNFGNLVKGTEEELSGTFQVRLLKSANEVPFDFPPEYTLVLGDPKTSQTTSHILNTTTSNGVALTYTLKNSVGQANVKRNLNGLFVRTNTKGANVQSGEFIDNQVSIKVMLRNQSIN